ncbi:distal tail protein Dit [Enterococcus casseliflavus]|uniref:distal tail protein Dit n=1 Tax=Enterococcus casseliflavus TaxID=37734 RepID=UPI003D0E7EA3
MISDLEIKLNDFRLSDYFDLTDEPDRGLFPEVQHELVQLAQSDGSRATSKRRTHRIITLPLYALSGNFRQTKDDLANVLFAEGRQRLWFSDEPDRYWLVELTGESSWKRSLDNRGEAYGELKFLCEDGLAHSINSRAFLFSNTEEGMLTTIQNNGTASTTVDFTVDFLSDANSIAFVSAEKVLQLGAAEAPDSIEEVPKTELVLKDQMTSSTSTQWNINQARIRRNESAGDHTSKRMGSLKYDSMGTWVSSTGSVTDEDKFWHGPSISRDIIEMENWEVWSAVTFKSTGGGKSEAAQEGLMEINVLDEDNNFLMGLQLMDGYPTLDKVSWTFFIGDNVVDWGYFPNSVMKSGGGFYGQVIFKKVDNKFSFKIARVSNNKETWKVSRETVNNTIASLSAKRVSYYMATYGKQPAYNMGVSFCQIKKINSLDPLNIPLTFFEGDYLQVINNKIYLNSVLAGDYRVVGGSNVFTVDANITTPIYCVTDGDVTATAEIRERFV